MIDRKRRMGIVVTSLMGAGTEKTILTLAESLAKEGCDVDLYILRHHCDYIPAAGVNCIWLNTTSNREARAKLTAEIQRRGANYDLFVISNAKYFDAVPVTHKVCSLHITPTAWIQDGPSWKFWSRGRKLRNLRKKFRNKTIIALSSGIRNDLVNNLRVPVNNVIEIVNPFDITQIREAAEEAGPLPKGRYIISIASLNKRKRHADTIQALAKIPQTDVSLVIVGKGKEEDGLRQLASKLGISERVIFWGWDANPYRLLRHASVSVLASEAEGSPRALIESLLVGTPAVASDCPSGPSEILMGPLAPYLTPIGDIHALTNAIELALNTYPDIPNEIASRFDSAAVAKQYIQLADSLSVD
jgi:glycosyltransferase involved in cell wall biosynthesis